MANKKFLNIHDLLQLFDKSCEHVVHAEGERKKKLNLHRTKFQTFSSHRAGPCFLPGTEVMASSFMGVLGLCFRLRNTDLKFLADTLQHR